MGRCHCRSPAVGLLRLSPGVVYSYGPIPSGTYKSAKAVWPIFQKQKYGRIITTCSSVGICELVLAMRLIGDTHPPSDGNFGQANYSTAKAAIIGFTKALAIEGRKYNILSNVLAPSAGTAMTKTIW
jgi:multifunctional beta-oxidation protein